LSDNENEYKGGNERENESIGKQTRGCEAGGPDAFVKKSPKVKPEPYFVKFNNITSVKIKLAPKFGLFRKFPLLYQI
jgi:hypothetical protein